MIYYGDVAKVTQKYVTVTEFRRHLAHYIAMVRYGDDFVCIRRRGCDPVFLVSHADMDLIYQRAADLKGGPRDAKGYRSGFGLLYWVRRLLKAEWTGDQQEMRDIREEMIAHRYGESKSDDGS